MKCVGVAAVLLLALSARPGFAQDSAEVKALGFSPDGRYFAFEQRGTDKGGPFTMTLGWNVAEDRQVTALYASGSGVGRSLIGPPDIPADRLRILRDAFNAMVKDPDFVADIKKVNVELDPLPGDRVQELIVRTLAVPASVRERAKVAFGR